MPIDKNRYPPNWEEISQRIKQRDNFTCQRCYATAGERTLTVAHLDRDETNWNVEDGRLETMCDACHLDYDLQDNLMRRRYGRCYRDDQLSLFDSKYWKP